MNLECDQKTLDEIEDAFKFNDAVLRHLTVKMERAVTEPSAMMKEEKSRSMTMTQQMEAVKDDAVAPEVPAVAA